MMGAIARDNGRITKWKGRVFVLTKVGLWLRKEFGNKENI